MRIPLTQEKLKSLLNYNSETGTFTWKHAMGPGKPQSGREAGNPTTDGYLRIQIEGRTYTAHRLAWLYMHGVWPAPQIDHIYGVRTDNRISQLRLATHAQNNRNRAMQRNNKSGFVGVRWNKLAKRWKAKICFEGKCIHLGYFSSAKDASEAYKSKAAQLFGPFNRAIAAQLDHTGKESV